VAVRTLVLWCPDWAVTAAGIAAEVPAAVVHANKVEASSPSARREGVVPGLRRREAQGRCPTLVVLERDPAMEVRAFEPIVSALERFNPRVEIRRPGECAFGTRGPSRYFGGDEALASRVAEAVAGVTGTPPSTRSPWSGVGWRVGVADGPFAAGLAARLGLVVPPGESATFLAPLPVATIGDPDLADLLLRLGVRTLGDLAALPEADVQARFGPDGARAHKRARGLDERTLSTRTPPPDLMTAIELDPPAERVDTVAFAARSLARDLHDRMGELGLACTRVRVETETAHGETLERVWSHDGPFSSSDLAERVRWQLEGWLTGRAGGSGAAPTAGLSLVRLVPDEVVPEGDGQRQFWGGASGIDDKASRALVRIQGMLGPDAVVTAVLDGGRGPAEQVRLVPWGDPRHPPARAVMRGGRTARPGDPPPWPGRLPAPAPALVHDRPLAAELVDPEGRPVRVSGRGVASSAPARLSVEGGRWWEVADWAGPWPFDERWWDPPSRRRRARIQVLLAGGRAHLLVLERGGWWVEATYD
jgi:protein ImuB